MFKILVVDDEDGIRQVLKEYLECFDYAVDEAENGIEAEEKFKNNFYNLVLLDIMMPQQDGYTTAKNLKKIKDIPIIMLSAKQEIDNKLEGFSIGIDDYITKPFELKEVLARVAAVITRANKQSLKDIININTLSIDIKNRKVTIDNREILMTPKEYELLYYFISHKNEAISRDQLLKDIWGYENFKGDDRTIDAHIKMLRNSLGEYRDIILTLRGLGYKCSF